MRSPRDLKWQGLSCDPVHARVPLVMPASPVASAPMRYESVGAPLQSIRGMTSAYVDFDGLDGGSVRSASVALRTQPYQDVWANLLDDIASLVALGGPAWDLIVDAAQQSEWPTLPVRASKASVRRSDQRIAARADLRAQRPDVQFEIPHIAPGDGA